MVTSSPEDCSLILPAWRAIVATFRSLLFTRPIIAGLGGVDQTACGLFCASIGGLAGAVMVGWFWGVVIGGLTDAGAGLTNQLLFGCSSVGLGKFVSFSPFIADTACCL